MKHRASFSMIELFVVIALLALLSTLLSPSLQRILQVSQQVKCHKNVKTIHLAFDQYTSDANEVLVYLALYNRYGQKGIWTWSLAPYLGYERDNKSPYRNVFYPQGKNHSLICPSFHEETPSLFTSYAYNRDAGWGNWQESNSDLFKNAAPVYLNNVSKPAQAITILENHSKIYNIGYFGWAPEVAHKHAGLNHRLFLDGHVELGFKKEFDQTHISNSYWYKWSQGHGQ